MFIGGRYANNPLRLLAGNFHVGVNGVISYVQGERGLLGREVDTRATANTARIRLVGRAKMMVYSEMIALERDGSVELKFSAMVRENNELVKGSYVIRLFRLFQ
jgi:hypothetical protein